jgi:uncharacterized protein
MDNTKHGSFSWNELTTNDPKAALEFYKKLFNWNTEVTTSAGFEYTVVKEGERPIGGVMKLPREGCPVAWMSYVTVDDVDETVRLATSLGGMVHFPPTDIPDVGRLAILGDPQGAVFAAITYIARQAK